MLISILNRLAKCDQTIAGIDGIARRCDHQAVHRIAADDLKVRRRDALHGVLIAAAATVERELRKSRRDRNQRSIERSPLLVNANTSLPMVPVIVSVAA